MTGKYVWAPASIGELSRTPPENADGWSLHGATFGAPIDDRAPPLVRTFTLLARVRF